MSELFGENDGMHGSHLSQDDSCTIGKDNHMRQSMGTPDYKHDNFGNYDGLPVGVKYLRINENAREKRESWGTAKEGRDSSSCGCLPFALKIL